MKWLFIMYISLSAWTIWPLNHIYNFNINFHSLNSCWISFTFCSHYNWETPFTNMWSKIVHIWLLSRCRCCCSTHSVLEIMHILDVWFKTFSNMYLLNDTSFKLVHAINWLYDIRWIIIVLFTVKTVWNKYRHI